MTTMRHFSFRRAAAIVCAAWVAGCATPTPQPDYDAQLATMMQSSFRDEGIAKVDRLQQDEGNAACSRAMGATLPEAVAAPIRAAALATIKPPADGRYLGDWREGEKLAQNGRGMTWTDPTATPASNGGNCYNCHQISPTEISYGTIGPSLLHYGRDRAVVDPASAESKAVVERTWAQLYNAKASNACSGMPRFGHAGLLDEKQLRHLMALLLDPKSPVNQ